MGKVVEANIYKNVHIFERPSPNMEALNIADSNNTRAVAIWHQRCVQFLSTRKHSMNPLLQLQIRQVSILKALVNIKIA